MIAIRQTQCRVELHVALLGCCIRCVKKLSRVKQKVTLDEFIILVE